LQPLSQSGGAGFGPTGPSGPTQPPGTTATSGPTGSGGSGAESGINITRTRRAMREYHLTDADLATLGMMNWISIVFFSVGAFFLTNGAEIAKDFFVSGKPHLNNDPTWSIMWITLGVAFAFYAIGIIAMIYRGTTVRRIRRESVG
jgi:hypothetical protein